MNEQERQNNILAILERLKKGAADTLVRDVKTHREVLKRSYEANKQDVRARSTMLGSNRSMIGDAMANWSDPECGMKPQTNADMGMGLSDDKVKAQDRYWDILLLISYKTEHVSCGG